jgi:hypothetical protein
LGAIAQPVAKPPCPNYSDFLRRLTVIEKRVDDQRPVQGQRPGGDTDTEKAAGGESTRAKDQSKDGHTDTEKAAGSQSTGAQDQSKDRDTDTEKAAEGQSTPAQD